MWQGGLSADDTRGLMKYAPLPWVHLADALKTSLRRLRIVLEEPAFTSERTFVRLHDGPRSESITETRPLLTGQNPLSARERAAVEILHEAGPSHAKKGGRERPNDRR